MLDLQRSAATLTDEVECSCQKPQIAVCQNEEFYICWQRMKEKQDDIMLGRMNREGGFLELPKVISDGGQAFMASLHVFGEAVYVTWSEWKEGMWYLYIREVSKDGNTAILLTSAAGIFHIIMGDDGSRLYVCWEELDDGGRSRVKGGWYEGNSAFLAEVCQISEGTASYRPAICFDMAGCLYAAYDCFDGTDYSIRLRCCKNGHWSGEITLSERGGWSSNISLVSARGIITAAWQEMCGKGNVRYWFVDLDSSQNQEKWINSEAKELANLQIWYAWNRLKGDGTGRQLLLLGHNMSQFFIRVRNAGEDWGKSVLATDELGLEGALYADAVLEGSDMYLVYQHSNCNGHQERNSSIRFQRLSLDGLELMDDSAQEISINEFYSPIAEEKSIDRISEKQKEAWLKRNGYDRYQLCFGDIHGQSNMSDGLGEPDQYYHYAEVKSRQDFTALTDHDVFPDMITYAEWEYAKTMANAYNKPEKMATLIAYEWTSNEFRYDFGHKNIYYPGDDGGLYRAGDIGGMTPDRLFAMLKKEGAIAVPHHPAATWGRISAATDWSFHDSQVQYSVEIFSRHAPFEKEGTSSIYSKNKQRLRGKYIQDALAKGYHLGFVAGSDSHQLEHGLEGGILGAFVERLDRKNVFEAIRSRFTYATTGAGMLLSMRLGEFPMGSEVTVFPCKKKLVLRCSVLGTASILSAEIVKNGVDIYQVNGIGKEWEMELAVSVPEEGEDYYYLRVTQTDSHQGWTSPIWIKRREL